MSQVSTQGEKRSLQASTVGSGVESSDIVNGRKQVAAEVSGFIDSSCRNLIKMSEPVMIQTKR